MAKRRKCKRITKELIRGYFGEDAEISWFCPWRVKTLTGGEAVISQRNIKVIFGTEDTYRAITLLIGECWGHATASNGSDEFKLAATLHGEAAGVPIKHDYTNRDAGIAQALVFCLIAGFGLMLGGAGLVIALALAIGVVAVMEQSAKREKEKKHEQMSFPYPRVHGSAGPARHEDLKRRGWL